MYLLKYYNTRLFSSCSINNSQAETNFTFQSLACVDKIGLHPYYVTGLTDGEGCFLINIRPRSKMKTGYLVELVFKLVLLDKDKALIEKLQSYFGVGTVTNRIDGATQY